MIDEEEARRREKVAYMMGVQEAKVAIYDDLRNLAGNFALEVYRLREALASPPDSDGTPKVTWQ